MNSDIKKVKVLVLGQTPPPYGGQALSIQSLVKANFEDLEIHHIRMAFSKSFEEVGKFKMKKIFHLLKVIILSVYKIFKYKIDIIHYPPGAQKIPLIRDIAVLLILRLTKRKLILIFHASGLSEEVSKWGNVLKWLFRKAFFFPEAAIQTSKFNPPDADFVKAKKKYIVYPGIKDEYNRWVNIPKTFIDEPVILYVGVIMPEKGVNVLVESLKILKDRGKSFRAYLVGEFRSSDYEKELKAKLKNLNLESEIIFTGPKVGDEKWLLYRNADIFCFPSFAPFESFGKVVVEAMMFELPVVATRWRGIQEIVEDSVTGFLVEPKNPVLLAEKLGILLANKELRIEMGKRGRIRYLNYFTEEQYLESLRNIFLEVYQDKL